MPYQLDKENFILKKVTTSVSRIVWRVLWWFTGSFGLAVITYAIVSLVVNTEQEKQLILENRAYEKMYGEMLQQQKILKEATEALQSRDNYIYDQIFHSEAPSIDPIASADLVMFSDTTSEKIKVSRTASRLNKLSEGASMVENNFLSVFAILAKSEEIPMPLICPIPQMNYAQTGASVGRKYNPFYKVETQHDGLDIIVGQGTPVLASADGIVTDVRRSGKGLGNVITLDHGNGYVTRYGHVSDILVSKGRKVSKGEKIASVGVSGNSFAPHLHYEILKDEVPADPINYMFATLTPKDYANVAYMSSRTGQSLD